MKAFSDPRIESTLKQIALSNGFNKWLKVEIIAVGNGQSELELTITPELLQHHGFVHGGVIGSLADIACSWAAASTAGDVVTQSLSLQLVSPAKGDLLTVRADTIKAGKRTVTVEAKVYCKPQGGEAKLVAVALASIANLSGE